MSGGIPRPKDTVSGPGDKSRHLSRRGWRRSTRTEGQIPGRTSAKPARCVWCVCRENPVAPGRRQPGWRAGQGPPASSPGGGFTAAPPRAAGRDGATPTANKRGDGWTPTSGQFSRWGPARAGLRPAHGVSVSGGVVPLPARTPPAEPAKCRRSRACKSLRRVAWALRRAPSPNCTFVTGRVCGPTRSWTFRCPPGSDAGQRPPPGELAGAPWRKRVGIEPTIPGTNPESTDLKSAEAARPHALPVRCSGLPRTAGRDPGGADGDRTDSRTP